MLTLLTKGGRWVSQLLTITDKEGWVQTHPNMADIICEQSLIAASTVKKKKMHSQALHFYERNFRDLD